MFILVCTWFVQFTSLCALYSSGQAATSRALSRLYIQLFFLNKKFQGGGQRVVTQEIINVRETVFSMYFVQTKEEIHLSFKNSEKQRTQAVTIFEMIYLGQENDSVKSQYSLTLLESNFRHSLDALSACNAFFEFFCCIFASQRFYQFT